MDHWDHNPAWWTRSVQDHGEPLSDIFLMPDAPTPPYYDYPPSLSPHPFMGLGKFVASRIHPMRAAKRYLAAHSSRFDENPNTACPLCGTEPESFQHAILACPAWSGARSLLLKEVSSLEHDAALWNDPDLIQALDKYISDTKTGFPPDMIYHLPRTPHPASPPLTPAEGTDFENFFLA